ncbi:MAG: hypothetical protein ACJAZF_002828, partial [Granulosicoccus sp.]
LHCQFIRELPIVKNTRLVDVNLHLALASDVV